MTTKRDADQRRADPNREFRQRALAKWLGYEDTNGALHAATHMRGDTPPKRPRNARDDADG